MTRIIGSFSVSGLYRRALREGAASALDLRGDTRRQYRFHESAEIADLEAIADDWHAVADDMYSAIDRLNARDVSRVP